ncbi:hypothetical protein [Reticulibacter mediterranei]|nr:hypothetical protein [Reticulibacter mediterranei]
MLTDISMHGYNWRRDTISSYRCASSTGGKVNEMIIYQLLS